MNYDGEDRRTPAGWHVDKSLSIGHILTTVTLMVGGIWYLAGQDQRITTNELNIAHADQTSKSRDLQIQNAQRDSDSRTAKAFERFEGKLDKIFEYIQRRD